MNPLGNHMQEILAEVPEAEMGDFATAMRSITQGRATFNFEFVRYEETPEFIAKDVIAAAEKAE
jgi:elongation factor G